LESFLQSSLRQKNLLAVKQGGWGVTWVLLAMLAALSAASLLARFRHASAPADQTYQLLLQQGEVQDPASLPPLQANAPGQLMTLDPTRKFLVNTISGKPVFITGEDAFSLQSQLSDADIQFYLNDRRSRGFNAIWVGLVDNAYNNHPPHDFYGNVPFNGADFTNENPAYWTRVDKTLTWAASTGITVLANPAFVGYGCQQGYCPSYRAASASVLTAYGQFLGNRYKNYSNIIWLIGGDADPTDKNVQSKLAALASGIRSADTVHLITTESYRGYSSEQVWGGAPWLDLDGIYEKPGSIVARARTDYQAGKYPVFMLEDWYEGEHNMTEMEVRQEGYWAVLSGSTLGRLFGNFAIWSFSWPGATTSPWKAQLPSQGSQGQALLGKLFRSREHWKLVPDIKHQVMTAGYGSGNTLAVAARTSDGQTVIAYIPNGSASAVTMDLSKITDAKSIAVAAWFNPRDGSATRIGAFPATSTHVFTPPDGNDWVLVLDSQSARLGAPGGKNL
jgi:hypothetical protein